MLFCLNEYEIFYAYAALQSYNIQKSFNNAIVPNSVLPFKSIFFSQEKYSEGKKDGKNKNTPTPLVLHLEADENHHPGHSHTAFMSLDQVNT